jgi:uncharacterized NAD-dependent epimerase/dehydratase family protein
MNKMKKAFDGKALVFCEGAFNTPNGKTAHGLVRFTERYKVVGVIDSKYSGQDAGQVLDQKPSGIPVFENFSSAIKELSANQIHPDFLVIGLAPDGGRLPLEALETIKQGIALGLNVDSGLHDFISDIADIAELAKKHGVKIRDVRKTPPRSEMHFFSGEIEKVNCLKIAVLGTDSAVGKRTTAWLIVHAMRKNGFKSELTGTGQTAWMQGAKYSMIMDSCINDFVSGEIEHAVVSAWKNEKPDLIVIEGQGSLMNPAYPGGFEILAAGRPDYVVLQHAPKRIEYDGFPGYPLHPLDKQIEAIEMISGKKVIAITVNHEGIDYNDIQKTCDEISASIGLPTYDVLAFGAEALAKQIQSLLK